MWSQYVSRPVLVFGFSLQCHLFQFIHDSQYTSGDTIYNVNFKLIYLKIIVNPVVRSSKVRYGYDASAKFFYYHKLMIGETFHMQFRENRTTADSWS